MSSIKTSRLQLFVSETIGSVSAELIEADSASAFVTLAHGAGAGMNHPFMVSLANELALQGISTLRFNFPFMENKKGRPDAPAVAHQTVEAAITKTQELFPSLPLFVSGKSFGGRMSSQYLAKAQLDVVKGVIFFGFPLHPAGKPSTERADHLKEVNVPMLFIQGTNDALAEWHLMEPIAKKLPSTTLQKIDGADHAFKAGKKNIIPALVLFTKEWVRAQIASGDITFIKFSP
jgi:predicted alpha/beta-hydrolase family hydrolase